MVKLLKINQAIIVEGKYDKIKLESVVDATIIPTNGFSIFSDVERLELIRHYACGVGIIILTDSDAAGFKIRNYLKGAIKGGNIINVYVPDIYGKEKRKNISSKEGKLGVEGIPADVIKKALERADIAVSEICFTDKELITRLDFYELGISGGQNSREKRIKILEYLKMPKLLSVTGMTEVLNTMMFKQEFLKLTNELLL